MQITFDASLKKKRIAIGLAISIALILSDFIYKSANGINYLTRSKCFLYAIVPKAGFLLFEYFVEIPMLVFVTIFLSTLIEKIAVKYRKFVPAHPITAFFYASALPVCSCAALPIVITLRRQMSLKVLLTFLIAAPLLNPYIIFLSFNILGVKYGILRIVAAFILSVSAGYLFEWILPRDTLTTGNFLQCHSAGCGIDNEDVFLRTYALFKTMIPYLLIGGLMAAGLAYLPSERLVVEITRQSNTVWGNLVLILAGIPFYLCNGVDVLLLKPLICSGMHLGTAMAVSLTVTSICITSILLLFKFFGKKFSLLLVLHIVITTLLISQTANWFFTHNF